MPDLISNNRIVETMQIKGIPKDCAHHVSSNFKQEIAE